MRIFAIPILILAGMLIWPGHPAQADGPAPSPDPVPQSPPGAGDLPPSPIGLVRSAWQKSMARVNRIEGVQMVTAVLAGSDMGPGDGWFHPGQSRYGWQWLVKRYDHNQDGVITADEFRGPAAMFERLDRDQSGELKADDFDWSDASPFIRQQGQAGQWFARFDNSSNGRITQDEWQQFFEKLAGEKGYISRDDLRMGLFPPPPKTTAPPAPGQDGPTRDVLLLGILSGELGSVFEGPRIDQQAPDFELESQDHKQRIRLSTYHNEKPVVLVFGSFT